MATDKLFKVFGVSKLDGEYKVRFANDIMRTKVLAKHGHTDIELVELSEAVTKYEGIKTIQSLPEFGDASSQSAIAEYLEEKAPKATVKAAPKAVKTPQVPALKGMTPLGVKAAKTAKVAEDEDAPF